MVATYYFRLFFNVLSTIYYLLFLAIRKTQTIPGLIGMTALCPPKMKVDFSVLGNNGRKKTERVMLVPVSAINHACQPNAEFINHGELSTTALEVKTTRPLKKGEEITLSYGEDFFGAGNKDCGCNDCKEEQLESEPTIQIREPENELPTSEIQETQKEPATSEIQETQKEPATSPIQET